MKKHKKSAKKVTKKETKTTETHAEPKIMPLGDRVLVRPIMASELEAKSTFGIIIPDTAEKERSEQGIVMAVGEGRFEDGKRVPIKLKVGDRIIFSKYGFEEVKNGDSELYIIKEENILAVIRK